MKRLTALLILTAALTVATLTVASTASACIFCVGVTAPHKAAGVAASGWLTLTPIRHRTR